MRAIFTLAAAVPALIALAACGRNGDEDAFRADYRQRSVAMCIGNAPSELASSGLWSEAMRPGLEPICGCTVDRALAELSNAELRSQLARTALTREERAAQARWFSECTIDYLRRNPIGDLAPPPIPAPSDGAGAPGAPGEPSAARPRANLSSYFSADDYPASAARNNEQGRTAFNLDVDANGRVTACIIRESSGSAALDAATCRIIRSRARYTPARDPNGKAIPGQDRGTVTWQLPKD